jgi:hypothetical protein
MDKNSGHKHGGNVVSRRGGHPQTLQASSDEVQPMLPAKGITISKGGHAAAPRSGPFAFPTLFVNDDKDGHDRRRFKVSLPTRMLLILVMVFLAVPLMVFFYKEVHIHEAHDEAHFKPEKFVNVNTHDVISQFSNHAQEVKHQHEKKHHEKTASSKEEEETGNKEIPEEELSTADSQSDKEPIVESENGQPDETEEEQGDNDEGSPDAGEKEKDDLVGQEEVIDGEGKGDKGGGDDKEGEGKGEGENGDEEGAEEEDGRRTKRLRRRD